VTIRGVLRHRAIVKRPSTTIVDGESVIIWAAVTTDLPCLLDVGTASMPEPTYTAEQQRTLDRSGTLFTLPTSDVKPGDRVVLTRGQSGTFLVKPDPATVSTLTGPHHREFRVEETP
jgi:hypothetical protein